MEAIIVKAAGFLLIIALGFILKSVGLFRAEDSRVLANLVLKITLPMSIIHNFATLTLSKTHLVPIGLGFLTNFAVIGLVNELYLSRQQSWLVCRHLLSGLKQAVADI